MDLHQAPLSPGR